MVRFESRSGAGCRVSTTLHLPKRTTFDFWRRWGRRDRHRFRRISDFVSASPLQFSLFPKETIIRSCFKTLQTPTQDVPDYNYDSRLRRKRLIALTLKKIVAKSPTKCDGFELFSDFSIISPTPRTILRLLDPDSSCSRSIPRKRTPTEEEFLMW